MRLFWLHFLILSSLFAINVTHNKMRFYSFNCYTHCPSNTKFFGIIIKMFTINSILEKKRIKSIKYNTHHAKIVSATLVCFNAPTNYVCIYQTMNNNDMYIQVKPERRFVNFLYNSTW